MTLGIFVLCNPIFMGTFESLLIGRILLLGFIKGTQFLGVFVPALIGGLGLAGGPYNKLSSSSIVSGVWALVL